MRLTWKHVLAPVLLVLLLRGGGPLAGLAQAQAQGGGQAAGGSVSAGPATVSSGSPVSASTAPANQGSSLQAAGVAGPSAPAQVPQGVELDRLVAVVNDEVVLESDVDEDRRLVAFQPFRDASRTATREQEVERLINRALILQQAKIQPGDVVTDKDVDDQLATLRKDIPACKPFQCETEAGWERFVTAQGFTVEELKRRWRERMEVLRFIEVRFRSGIQISDSEIRDYYEKTLLPQYAKEKAAPPKLETISNRIQEILLQQQVSSLLSDWLKSLRAQGTVRIIQQGEAQP